jgi:N-acyl-L-homoserine lactone synthetase
MQLHLFTFVDMHFHGNVYIQYLALRKAVFVDHLNWNLSHDGTYEMDQYDTPRAIYSIVTKGGKVVCGARAIPSDHVWLGWSYMLKDAAMGKILGIPSDLTDYLPCDKYKWEATRLALNKELPTHERKVALQLCIDGLVDLIASKQGMEMFSVSPAPFGRLLTQLGYEWMSEGDCFRGLEDNRAYKLFRMETTCAVKQLREGTYPIDYLTGPDVIYGDKSFLCVDDTT